MLKLRVLIVEDHVDIAENIADYLEAHGHNIDFAYDGQMAINLMTENEYDAILMDIMMPNLNGYEATKEIRKLPNGDIPVLMLTAKDHLDEKLEGFDCGADDYIVKPFAMSELHARLQAHAGKKSKSTGNQLTLGKLTLKLVNQEAEFSDVSINLNPTTFKILWELTTHYPNLVKKTDLVFHIWGNDSPETDLLRGHIYSLRKQLEKVSPKIDVKSKHGLGYRLNLSSETSPEHSGS